MKLLRFINGKDVDIFKRINLDNNKNEIQLHSKHLNNNLSRALHQTHYSNLNLIINFKAVKKINFI